MSVTFKCPRCTATVVWRTGKEPVCFNCGWRNGYRARNT